MIVFIISGVCYVNRNIKYIILPVIKKDVMPVITNDIIPEIKEICRSFVNIMNVVTLR